MKRLLFTALLILGFASVVSSQNKIDGIGKFRLGATTEEVKKILVEICRDTFKDSSFSQIPAVTNNFEKLDTFCAQLRQNADSTFSNAPLDKNEDIFYIKEYKIVNGISIYDVYLHFYNDLLYCIEGGFSDNLIDAFKVKYGDPKEERRVKPSGDIDEIWTWDTGIPSVLCMAVRMLYSTNKDEIVEHKAISIWDSKIHFKVYNEEQKIKARWKNQERMNKLKELEAL